MLTYSIDNSLHSQVEGSLVFTGAALRRPLRAVIGAPEPIRIISTFIKAFMLHDIKQDHFCSAGRLEN